MLASFSLQPDGSGLAVIRSEGEEQSDRYVTIPADTMAAFLDSHGDGLTSYREDLIALVG